MIVALVAALVVAGVAVAVAAVAVAKYLGTLERRLDGHDRRLGELDDAVAGLGVVVQEHATAQQAEPPPAWWKPGS